MAVLSDQAQLPILNQLKLIVAVLSDQAQINKSLNHTEAIVGVLSDHRDSSSNNLLITQNQ